MPGVEEAQRGVRVMSDPKVSLESKVVRVTLDSKVTQVTQVT